MRNVTLTTHGSGKEVVVNWDNVYYAKEMSSPYGGEYVEVSFGDDKLDVKESLQDIEQRLKSPHEKFEEWRDKAPTQLG